MGRDIFLGHRHSVLSGQQVYYSSNFSAISVTELCYNLFCGSPTFRCWELLAGFLNRLVATQFLFACILFWVDKNIVVFWCYIGRHFVFCSVLWVANFQVLRSTVFRGHNLWTDRVYVRTLFLNVESKNSRDALKVQVSPSHDTQSAKKWNFTLKKIEFRCLFLF